MQQSDERRRAPECFLGACCFGVKSEKTAHRCRGTIVLADGQTVAACKLAVRFVASLDLQKRATNISLTQNGVGEDGFETVEVKLTTPAGGHVCETYTAKPLTFIEVLQQKSDETSGSSIQLVASKFAFETMQHTKPEDRIDDGTNSMDKVMKSTDNTGPNACDIGENSIGDIALNSEILGLTPSTITPETHLKKRARRCTRDAEEALRFSRMWCDWQPKGRA